MPRDALGLFGRQAGVELAENFFARLLTTQARHFAQACIDGQFTLVEGFDALDDALIAFEQFGIQRPQAIVARINRLQFAVQAGFAFGEFGLTTTGPLFDFGGGGDLAGGPLTVLRDDAALASEVRFEGLAMTGQFGFSSSFLLGDLLRDLLSDGSVVLGLQAGFHGLLGTIKRPLGVIEGSLNGLTRLSLTACKPRGG